MAYQHVGELLNGYASSSWPTTQGVVVKSETEVRTLFIGVKNYQANIQYLYRVDGKEYVGGKVSFGEVGGVFGEAVHKLVSKYQVTDEVTVYFKPQNPEICTLRPGAGAVDWGFSITGLLLLIISIFKIIQRVRLNRG